MAPTRTAAADWAASSVLTAFSRAAHVIRCKAKWPLQPIRRWPHRPHHFQPTAQARTRQQLPHQRLLVMWSNPLYRARCAATRHPATTTAWRRARDARYLISDFMYTGLSINYSCKCIYIIHPKNYVFSLKWLYPLYSRASFGAASKSRSSTDVCATANAWSSGWIATVVSTVDSRNVYQSAWVVIVSISM